MRAAKFISTATRITGTVLALIVAMSSQKASALPVAHCKNQNLSSNVASVQAQLTNINLFVADNRVVQQRTGTNHMFQAIGGLKTNQKVPLNDTATGEVRQIVSQSTAFLVSPCYILTTYHSVFGDSSTPDSDAKHVSNTFYAFNGEGNHYQPVKATPVSWGRRGTSGADSDDWTIEHLDSCVGEKLGWVELAIVDDSKKPGLPVVAMGFHGDKDAGSLITSPSCKLDVKADNEAGAWLNNCGGRPGASGSPVFHVGADGVPRAVAMQARSLNETAGILPKYDRSHAMVAVDLSSFIGFQMDMLKNDRSRLKSNPALDTQIADSTSI